MPENEVTEELTKESKQPPKPVYFTYKGKDYTLDFSRFTARLTEERYNLDIPALMEGRIMCAPDVFKGSLLRHHPEVTSKQAEEMWNAMKEKAALYRRLFTLLVYTVGSTFEEPDEGNGVSWT